MLEQTHGKRKSLRVGTRGSLLARTQTAWVVSRLQAAWPELDIQTILIQSTGDRIQDKPLYEFGGKGLFTKELELGLLDEEIDVAVHSFKDVPVTMPLVEQAGLIFPAVPPREDVRDVLICSKARGIADLPRQAKVGTGSLRRRCQLLHLRHDLHIEMIRGNIDTRIRKLREGQYDAIVLAMAGVKRAGLWDEAIMTPIPADAMVPSAGQGALALQCRKGDPATRAILASLDHPISRECVEVERELVRRLEGDCHSPIGAWARLVDGKILLDGMLGCRDGNPPVVRASGASAEEVYRALTR